MGRAPDTRGELPAPANAEHHTEDSIWGALGERGFDPGYQEVMVSEAHHTGRHWSFQDGTEIHRHTHIEAEGNGYKVWDAGRECRHRD